MSNRCKIGSVNSTFSAREKEGSYRPPMGLAAAMTAHRACNDATMPVVMAIGVGSRGR